MIGNALRTRTALQSCVGAACVIIPFLTLAAVIALSVNVPYYDEFAYQGFLYRRYLGELTLADVWRYQNSEHRIFFNTIVFWILAQWGGWDVVREQCFSVASLAATQLVLWRIVLRTIARRYVVLALLSVSFALYSLAQAENLAWGIEMVWFIPNLCLVAVVWLLTRGLPDLRSFAAAVAVATIGSLTMTQGLIIWPVGFVCMLVRREPVRRQLAWVVLGAVVIGIVRTGIRPVASVPHVPLAAHIGDFALFVFAYLGAPLAGSYGVQASAFCGALALLALAALVVLDLRAADRSTVIAQRLPWYAIAFYVLIAAIVTAYGRVGYGVTQAVAGHYITLQALFSVGLLGALASRFGTATSWKKAAIGTAAGVITLCVVQQSAVGWSTWQAISERRQADFAAIVQGDVLGADDLWPDPRLLHELLLEMQNSRTGIFRR
jgi:hypothetical protein